MSSAVNGSSHVTRCMLLVKGSIPSLACTECNKMVSLGSSATLGWCGGPLLDLFEHLSTPGALASNSGTPCAIDPR